MTFHPSSLPVVVGGAAGEEGDETSPDGGQSGSAGTATPPGQPASLRQRLARAQSRHRLVNKPQDFQVSVSGPFIHIHTAARILSIRWTTM